MKRYKVGVIGAGNMGLNHIRTYASIPEVEMVAISELNKDLGKKISNEFKVKFYSDYLEMLSKEKLDIVSVCVPSKFHFKVASEVIKHNVNLLLEKPITLNVAQANKLIAEAKLKNVFMLVGHIERFNPVVKKVKEMIDKKELGDIIAIIVRRVGGFPPQITDANIAVDLSIHDIDIVNYLLGELPQKITVNKQKNHITKREDSVEFFLKYKKSSAYIQSNWVTPVKIRKLNITGMKGYLEMDFLTQEIDFYKSNYIKFKQKFRNYSDYILEFSDPDKINIKVAKKEPLKEEIKFFIESLNKKKNIDSSFAVDALKIALKK